MKIYVVTHKPFEQPKSKIYKVIKVGNGDFEIDNSVSDSTGDNISTLNNKYCELTALYWIWKNSDENVVGLNHYRRYFKCENKLLTSQDAEKLLRKYDLIVPKKRNYLFFTIHSHYVKAHNHEDLDIIRDVISKRYPEYSSSFDSVMKSTKLSLYNMFLMKKYILDEYCEFLFDILTAADKRINAENYDSYQKRVIGFLAERIFNVWIEKNKSRFKMKYLPVVNTEGEPVVKKIINLLKRHVL